MNIDIEDIGDGSIHHHISNYAIIHSGDRIIKVVNDTLHIEGFLTVKETEFGLEIFI